MQAGFVADKSLGYVQITGGALDAGGLLSALAAGGIPAGAIRVKINVATQAIRWRDDGQSPTAGLGMPQAAGSLLDYQERDLGSLRLISQVAGAVLDVTFYGTN